MKCALAFLRPIICRILSGGPNIPNLSSMMSVMATAVTGPDSSLTIGYLEKYSNSMRYFLPLISNMYVVSIFRGRV